jgi:hypothetical protein
LTRTVPTPGTLLALIVTPAADALAGALAALATALLVAEPAALVAEPTALPDEEEHAATTAAAPTARPPAISLRAE